MKVRKSEITNTQESQESQNTTKSSKGAGTSSRTARASADSVEMISSAKSKSETSGTRELTADQQAMAPKVDPQNYTSLLSGTDPRAALENARPGGKQRQSPQHGNGTLPNGQSASRTDLSQYNVQTAGAPPMLKDSIGQLGNRADELKGARGQSASDRLNVNNMASRNQGAARSHMNVKDGAVENAWNWVKQKVSEITADDVKETATEYVLDEAADKAGKAGGSVVDTLAKPLTGIFTVQEVLGKEEGPKAYLDGWKALLGDPDKRPGMPGKDGLQDVPPDVDGTGNPDWNGIDGDSLLPEQLRTRNILQGTTGRGPGGGEVVNPSREDSGGGQGAFDDHGAFKARLGYDNSHYLIGQPAGPEEETGFNGLSGVDPSDPFSGGVSDADWTGPTRTEEPGGIQTAPGGDGQLSHLVNNEDEDDRK